MQVSPVEIDTVLTLLKATPPRLAAMTNGYEPVWLQTNPDEDSWSANDILAHLRACADVWGKSMLTMIAQERPTLRYISPRTWIRKTDYPAQEFHRSLLAFTQQRDNLLHALHRLKPADWARGATFTGTVKGREQTVLSYAQRLAEHEQQHLAQLESLLLAMKT